MQESPPPVQSPDAASLAQNRAVQGVCALWTLFGLASIWYQKWLYVPAAKLAGVLPGTWGPFLAPMVTLVLTFVGVGILAKLFKQEDPEITSGIVGLAMVAHVVVIGICWFGDQAGQTISDVKASSDQAPLIPRAFKLDASAMIVPDANKFFVEGRDLGSSEPTEERAKQTIFVACESTNWPDASTAVVLRGTGAEVLGGLLQSGATGTYRKMPLTHEMRAEWPEWDGKVENVVVYDMGRSPRDLVATAGRNYLWLFGLSIGVGLLAALSTRKQA